MNSPGRPPVTIDLSAPGSETSLKDKPFTIKEGAKFTMSATFKVQHEILSGLHYVQVVKRKGIRVSKDSEMIVSQTMIGTYNTQRKKLKRRKEKKARLLTKLAAIQGSYAPNTDKQTTYTKKCTSCFQTVNVI